MGTAAAPAPKARRTRRAQRKQEILGRVCAERRFRDLLEAAPDSIIEVDAEGRILLVNAVTEQSFGYGREEMLGHSVGLLVPEPMRAQHAGHRGEYWAQPTTRLMGPGMELYGQRKDGSRFPVEISLSPVYSREGLRVIAIVRDITERKEAESRLHAIQARHTEELEMRNREIERANRCKSEFLANMSHELRTPLHTVIGFSELLAEETRGPLNDDQKRFIGHIRRDSEHLLTLINEILDLSKIEAGKTQLRREALDIGAMARDVISAIRPQSAAKSIGLGESIPGEAVTVNGDRIRIKQILYNLLSNAVKFTPPGGSIRISVRAAGGFGEVAVADTGVGIPLKEQELIFDPFYQTGEAAVGTREGTGLGLPITRSLIEEHGGRIWVESEPGKGSRFAFTIPLGQENDQSTGG